MLKSQTQQTDPKSIVQLLWVLRGADLQNLAPQQFTQVYAGNAYAISNIFGRLRTGAPSVLTAGGITDGSHALVSSTQLWTSIGGALLITLTLASLIGSTLLTVTPALQMAVPSSSAATADVYIFGFDLT